MNEAHLGAHLESSSQTVMSSAVSAGVSDALYHILSLNDSRSDTSRLSSLIASVKSTSASASALSPFDRPSQPRVDYTRRNIDHIAAAQVADEQRAFRIPASSNAPRRAFSWSISRDRVIIGGVSAVLMLLWALTTKLL